VSRRHLCLCPRLAQPGSCMQAANAGAPASPTLVPAGRCVGLQGQPVEQPIPRVAGTTRATATCSRSPSSPPPPTWTTTAARPTSPCPTTRPTPARR
jgi:hypothetical protein